MIVVDAMCVLDAVQKGRTMSPSIAMPSSVTRWQRPACTPLTTHFSILKAPLYVEVAQPLALFAHPTVCLKGDGNTIRVYVNDRSVLVHEVDEMGADDQDVRYRVTRGLNVHIVQQPC